MTTGTDDTQGPTDSLTAAAFDALPAQVAVLDADGTILRTNRAWADFGVENGVRSDAEMVGENYLAACDAADDPEAATAAAGIRSVLAGETDSFSFEYPCHSPAERRWFTMRAIRLPEYDPARALVMHTDITDRKEAELHVAAHNERLATVASVLSHDLRNPLSVVLARAEQLARGGVDPEAVAEHAETIASSARRIDDIIDDALLIARETRSVDPEPVDLERIATDAWSHVDTGAATLVVTDTVTVDADRSLLSQLFENCVRNALDHGPDDVTVTVSPVDGGFAVADDGPGIPADERERVFETGYTTNREGGGTGMGLAIVRAIAGAHDWEVRVEDADGGGVRFVVTGVATA